MSKLGNILGAGGRIRHIREKLDLNQEEFAAKLGIRNSTVSRYEAGRLPKPPMLDKIAEIGKTSREWILHGDRIEPKGFSAEAPKTELLPVHVSSPHAQDEGTKRLAKTLLVDIVDLMEECLAERGNPVVPLDDFIRLVLLLYDRYSHTARNQVNKATVNSYLGIILKG